MLLDVPSREWRQLAASLAWCCTYNGMSMMGWGGGSGFLLLHSALADVGHHTGDLSPVSVMVSEVPGLGVASVRLNFVVSPGRRKIE